MGGVGVTRAVCITLGAPRVASEHRQAPASLAGAGLTAQEASLQ